MSEIKSAMREVNGKVFDVEAGNAAPIRVVSVEQTCFACPAQWSGKTDDDRDVYVRYRGGCGYVSVGRRTEDNQFGDMPGEGGEIVVSYDRRDDDGWDGFMDEHELRVITEGFVTWDIT